MSRHYLRKVILSLQFWHASNLVTLRFFECMRVILTWMHTGMIQATIGFPELMTPDT